MQCAPGSLDTRYMPYRYEIDVDRRVVIATLWGSASIVDVRAIMAELYADPKHSFSMHRVYDCRDLTRLPTVGEIRGVAEMFRQRVDPGIKARRAVVVNPGAQYGLGRMFQALLDLVGVELNVFSDLEEAITWAAEPGPRAV